MSRTCAAGADYARGLLFTVLCQFVLPSGGTAWTSSFIEVFARMGVEETATRQALMRTAADGLPTALLPPGWGGIEAARLFNRLHTWWSAHAATE